MAKRHWKQFFLTLTVALVCSYVVAAADDTRLPARDGSRYASIFVFQDGDNFKEADEEIKNLEDSRLMGHVLYQRYLSPHYKASYAELADWMATYSDHPGAQKIHALAESRRPKKDAARLLPPRSGKGISGYHDEDSGQLAQSYLAEQKFTQREHNIMRAIRRNLSLNPTSARTRLESPEAKKIFSPTKYDALRALVAESQFYNGRTSEAHKLAAASADRSGKDVPLAGWIAGLSAWKEERYDVAAKYFESAAGSPRASSWMLSASAYWAARSYLRSHQPQKVADWLHRAAEHPRSFYGIIAIKALGMEQTRFNWDMPHMNSRLITALNAVPAGQRALALVDSRQPALAEQELRQINPGNDKTLQEAMMALAHTTGIPAFEMRLGSGLKNKNGELYDAALYPDVPWQPAGGYQVDKALVYAFIRQESKFDAAAGNKTSGAVGLMQLMPSTAMLVARRNNIKLDREQLRDPVVNIGLGQKYLEDLLEHENVRGNLFKLAVAYNAGPGKLARWEKNVNYEDDPLLFVESIPVPETRIFVERVLTNYWIYRLKYDQNPDSLDKVASGAWPVYTSRDDDRGFSFVDASDVLGR